MKTRTKDNRRSMPPKNKIDTSTYLGRVAVRLHALRIEAGLSVEKLSDRLIKAGSKATPSTIYSWEQGRSTPHVSDLPLLAKVYKLDTPGDVLPPK